MKYSIRPWVSMTMELGDEVTVKVTIGGASGAMAGRPPPLR